MTSCSTVTAGPRSAPQHASPPRSAGCRPSTVSPDFLVEMGVGKPSALSFSQLLRRTVRASVEKGYSRWGLEEMEAKVLRLKRENGVQASHYVPAFGRSVAENDVLRRIETGAASFFPGQPKRGGRH